jgi:hypothetical protein
MLQSEPKFDADGSTSEEETLDEPSETTQDPEDTAHNTIPDPGMETCAFLISSVAKRTTPKPVSIEEIEDEDFQPGAHPNCEAVGSLSDDYDALNYEACSDDYATESSEHEEDGSDEDDISSSKISPDGRRSTLAWLAPKRDDWRSKSTPLLREAERVESSSQGSYIVITPEDSRKKRSVLPQEGSGPVGS